MNVSVHSEASVPELRLPPAAARRIDQPAHSKALLTWFSWYSARYLRKHFHTIRVARFGEPAPTDGLPVVVYLNHASWWDPLVCLFLKNQFFAERRAFAPIDSGMLKKYPFFKRLGFFGVEQGTPRGAYEFLRNAIGALDSNGAVLFVTPQGRFADVRERPVTFAKGIGHLAARLRHAVFLPLALEYVFWEERLPEVLVRFGNPVEVHAGLREVFDARYWTRLLELKLAEAQDALALDAEGRNPREFRELLRGTSGVVGIYDLWRSVRARWQGETFRKEHGRL